MSIAVVSGGSTKGRGTSLESAAHVETLFPGTTIVTYLIPEDLDRLPEEVLKHDLVVPMVHGQGGEDGSITALCERSGVPFLFSPSQKHALCHNKNACKNKVASFGIYVPQTYESVKSIQKFPVIVKPIGGGSSHDTSIHYSAETLREIDFSGMIIEQYIAGKEFTAGVVDTLEDLVSLPIVEIRKKAEIFDVEEKYPLAHEIEVCPSEADPELQKQIELLAIQINQELGLRHMSRSDFIVDGSGDIYFLEVNTIPGLTKNSLTVKELRAAKIDLKELFGLWLKNI